MLEGIHPTKNTGKIKRGPVKIDATNIGDLALAVGAKCS